MQNSIKTINTDYVISKVNTINPATADFMSAYDDISSAQLFMRVFGEYVRYNATAKAWYVYDGVVWKPDPEDLVVERYSQYLARALLRCSADTQSQVFLDYVYKMQKRPQRRTMLEDARNLVPVLQHDFDTDPYLFNCQNGVLNLRDGTFMKHDPRLLLTKVANVAYDPIAKHDIFDEFMDQIMLGDQPKIEYLQTLFGYAMTGTNEREECYMLYGSTTRNGKGTLTNTMNHLFGGYGANIQPETLAMQKNRDGRQASGDIARLDGVRFLQMSEPPKRMKLDVALLKTLTGRDVITARRLYESEFQFIPCFKLFINTNFLPVVLDDTLFSSGRVKVITFDRHFSDSEQDHSLKDRLQQPEVLSGILNWCIEGLNRYHEHGNTIRTPDNVRKTTDDYRQKSDKVKSFIEEVLVENPFVSITARDVYTAYVKWCQLNGYGVENKSNFFDELRTKGLLSESGTVNGKTVHNVVKGYMLEDDLYMLGKNNDQ